ARGPVRVSAAALVARPTFPPLSHGAVSPRSVAALREHRNRVLVASVEDRNHPRDHIGRVAGVVALTVPAALLRIPLLSRPTGSDEAASLSITRPIRYRWL